MHEGVSLWERLCAWTVSTENRLHIGGVSCLMFPELLTATSCLIVGFVAAPSVDIDGIRKLVAGSLSCGNNIVAGSIFLVQTQLTHVSAQCGNQLQLMSGHEMVVLTNYLFVTSYF